MNTMQIFLNLPSNAFPIGWQRIANLLLACTLIFFLAILSACGKKDSTEFASSHVSPNDFTILAGSEIKDLEPLLPALEKATGLHVRFIYSGTIEAVERLQSGEAFDAAWLASNRYAMLTPGVKEKILASERTMLTPVVLGLKRSKAQSLGWLDATGKAKTSITWKDIAQAAAKERFSFGMTNPSASNTGFSGLIGVAAALAGKGDALEVKDIHTAELKAFFKAQTLTAGSSGWLSDAYVKEQGRIDGIISYASSLLSLNASNQLTEPLVLIYPQEGIITADYPLMLLNTAKRADYDKLIAYVRSPDFQAPMAQTTWRKPVVADVPFDAQNYPANLIELPFPAKLAVVDAVLKAFDDELRRPADSSFVLDISGSMSGKRMDQMKSALSGLTGLDNSLSGRFSRLRARENIVMTAFDDTVRPSVSFSINQDQSTQSMQAVRDYIDQLDADGGTAIFSAAQSAYQDAAKRRLKAPERYYSIVLLTDGQSHNGLSAEEFSQWYGALPENEKNIRVFAIQFGDANPDQLQKLAQLTGGRVFNATSTPLAQVFKEIRGYQ
jgi:Ca-activated chloride channel family protein